MSRKATRTWLAGIALLVLALALSGCAGSGTRAALTGSSWPGITLEDDTIYIASGPQVFSIDPETQTDNWAFPAEPDNDLTFYAPPAIGDEIVVVTDYSEKLHVLDRESGTERWSFTSGSRFIGGAVIDDGSIYAATVDGTLYRIDRESREAVWTFSAERDIWSTPLLNDGTVYVTSLDKHLYAIDANSGSRLWQFPAEGDSEYTPENVGAMVGTPTLYEGMLYFGSFGNKVFALDIETQNVLWEYETSNWVWGSPVVDEEAGLLIGGDLDGHVYALDIDSGEEVWSFDTDGPVVGMPALGENEGERVVYVSSGDTNLYAIKVSDGTLAAPPAELTAEFNAFLSGTNVRAIPIYTPPTLYNDMVLIGAHEGPCPLFEFNRDSLLGQCLFETPES